MGPDFTPKMPVKSLSFEQIVCIHQLFRQAKFDDPSGDLSLCAFLGDMDWSLTLHHFLWDVQELIVVIFFTIYSVLALQGNTIFV